MADSRTADIYGAPPRRVVKIAAGAGVAVIAFVSIAALHAAGWHDLGALKAASIGLTLCMGALTAVFTVWADPAPAARACAGVLVAQVSTGRLAVFVGGWTLPMSLVWFFERRSELALPLVAFTVACAVMLWVANSRRVRFTTEEFVSTGPLRRDVRLRWKDVRRVSVWPRGIQIATYDQRVVTVPCQMLDGYAELVSVMAGAVAPTALQQEDPEAERRLAALVREGSRASRTAVDETETAK